MEIRSLISYEDESARELLDDFHDAVDDYLKICKAEGKEPEVAFEGSFNIRLSPDLHKKLFIYTTAHQMFAILFLLIYWNHKKHNINQKTLFDKN